MAKVSVWVPVSRFWIWISGKLPPFLENVMDATAPPPELSQIAFEVLVSVMVTPLIVSNFSKAAFNSLAVSVGVILIV